MYSSLILAVVQLYRIPADLYWVINTLELSDINIKDVFCPVKVFLSCASFTYIKATQMNNSAHAQPHTICHFCGCCTLYTK